MNIDKLKGNLVRKSLYEFVKEFWRTCDAIDFIEGDLVEYLCEAFTWSVRKWLPENVTKHFTNESDYSEILNLVKTEEYTVYDFRNKDVNNHNFNMPPGHTKSMILNVLGPVWLFGHTAVRVASVSHTEPLATSMNLKRQKVLNSEKWAKYFPDVKLVKDQGKLLIGSHLGELYSANMASFTGYSAEIVINDDIVSSEQARKDKQALANAIDYYRDTMPNRIRDDAKGVIWNIQQRLAPGDISGYIQSTPELNAYYTNTILRAITEENTTLIFPVTGKVWHLKKGDPLWPQRFGKYERLKATQGNSVFETQYQQKPLASDATYIKQDMIKSINYDQISDVIKEPDNIYGSHDFPIKDKETSDFLGSVLGYQKHNNLYIMDAMEKRMAYVKSREYVINMHQIYKGIIQIIEDKANGSPILQELQGTISGLIAYNPGSKSKAQRLESSSVRLESGNVIFVKTEYDELTDTWNYSPKIQMLIDRLISYPFVKYDDVIDAFTQLVNYVYLHKRFGLFDKSIDDNNFINNREVSIYRSYQSDVAMMREGTLYKLLKTHYDFSNDSFIILDELTFRADANEALEYIKEFSKDSRLVIDATKENILYSMYMSKYAKILSNNDARSVMQQLSQIQAGLSMKRIKINRDCVEFRQDLDSIALDKNALQVGIERLESNEGLVACLRVLIYMYKGSGDFY